MTTKARIEVLIIVINVFLMHDLFAQNRETSVINDASFTEKIEKQADLRLKDKEWKIENLRKTIADLKETDRAQLSLPKPETKGMTPEEIYEKRSKGTILVSTYYNCGNCSKMHTSTASGAILTEDGYAVTNYHVLENIIRGSKESKSRDSLVFIANRDGNIYRIADIIAYSGKADLAIFKIDTKGEKFSPVPLGIAASPGTRVHAITHPDSRYYFYSQGVVARNVAFNNLDADEDRMEITADYAKGSSGGPILDSCGNLIGLVSTTQSIYYVPNEQKDLQMVIKSTVPVSAVKRLLKN
ncbi:serine endoprotease [Sphingobacterium spiritivorum]|uniref:Serine endoprotease n=1 Tax=Sphingobacterium spiritivorum TaxID=258 RepID=A0A380CRN3_SPHSI|nr:serine protease [Sphingobacterium spiritivorum]SUJ27379.1 serine endoprotease [Sphingobacterium spiritivorum]